MSKLSKQNYCAIAGLIKDELANWQEKDWQGKGGQVEQVQAVSALSYLTIELAKYFKGNNKLFNVEKFVGASGVSDYYLHELSDIEKLELDLSEKFDSED